MAALAGFLVVVTGMIVPASAAVPTPSDGNRLEIRWTDEQGIENGARALSLAEVKARGLEKYVDVTKYTMRPPTLNESASDTTRSAGSDAPEPVKQSKSKPGDATTLATGCWEHWFGYGTSALWGRSEVSWCGDGTWVTYSGSFCYGDNNAYPTYKYLGCSHATDFGSLPNGQRWNVYDVWSKWDLCVIWVPVWGSCTTHDRPWAKYRYSGGGGIWRLGGTS
ncbi:hypothetical protein ACFXOR_07725 [Streptomyces sp. NPDC059164]|uniref:hypothetical protein n=1 Tax=unclassified Streptomyces TaxID=2593676 RepID=UPI0036B4D34E